LVYELRRLAAGFEETVEAALERLHDLLGAVEAFGVRVPSGRGPVGPRPFLLWVRGSFAFSSVTVSYLTAYRTTFVYFSLLRGVLRVSLL
jgi:hypothetical protein